MLFFLLILLFSLAQAHDPLQSVYFAREALAPIETGLSPESQSAKSCQVCHQKIFEDWQKTKHADSFTNQNFLEGYSRETQDRCLNCHSPLKDRHLAHEGVTCVACHVRDGKMHSSSSAYHNGVKTNFLKEPRFCASCHEFTINGEANGKIYLTDVNAQSTYSEWLRYQKRGGEKTCQACHMPGGRHIFQGAHDRDASPVNVLYQDGVFQLSLKEMGHNFPSGDVFRRVTLEVRKGPGQEFKVIATFGRTYLREPFRLASDTSLSPGEIRKIATDIKPPFAYRLMYHFMRDQDKAISNTLRKDRERLLLQNNINTTGKQ